MTNAFSRRSHRTDHKHNEIREKVAMSDVSIVRTIWKGCLEMGSWSCSSNMQGRADGVRQFQQAVMVTIPLLRELYLK